TSDGWPSFPRINYSPLASAYRISNPTLPQHGHLKRWRRWLAFGAPFMSAAKLSPDQIRQFIADAKAGHSAPKGPSLVPTEGQNSHFTEQPWPTMGDDDYHGLAGDVVRAIEPHTESDPVAILIQFLTCAGNIIDNCPYYQVEGSRHRTNLFSVLVGDT